MVKTITDSFEFSFNGTDYVTDFEVEMDNLGYVYPETLTTYIKQWTGEKWVQIKSSPILEAVILKEIEDGDYYYEQDWSESIDNFSMSFVEQCHTFLNAGEYKLI